jgi:UDP-N-acetylmuramoylalanine--D-glutamate ligase
VVERAATLEEAVGRAVARVPAGGVVLLSTGHASWGMFNNYEQRGEAFRQAARALGMKDLDTTT